MKKLRVAVHPHRSDGLVIVNLQERARSSIEPGGFRWQYFSEVGRAKDLSTIKKLINRGRNSIIQMQGDWAELKVEYMNSDMVAFMDDQK